MNAMTRTALDNLHAEDKGLQNKAFLYLLEQTAKPVDWAYDVWDEMVATLRHKDNHQRAIAAQVLCNLAKSDPKKRMLYSPLRRTSGSSPQGTACSHCGKLALQARINRRSWLTVLHADSKSAPRKRTAR